MTQLLKLTDSPECTERVVIDYDATSFRLSSTVLEDVNMTNRASTLEKVLNVLPRCVVVKLNYRTSA